MSETFDPYHRWLGIPPEQQPPDHYRLLGIAPFEADREVIDSVAMRHMGFLQEITDGPYVQHAQQLLNELAAARRCLLDPARKAAYDDQLRLRLSESTPMPPPIASSADLSDRPSPRGPDAPSNSPPVLPSPTPVDSASKPDLTSIPGLPSGTRRAAGSRRQPSHRATGRGVGIWLDFARLFWRAYRLQITVATIGLFGLVIAAAWFAGSQPHREPSAARAVPQADHVAAEDAAADLASELPALADQAGVDDPLAASPLAAVDTGLPSQAPMDPGDVDTALPAPALDAESPATLAEELALFPPLQLDGLLLWLDAADRTSLGLDNASRVSTWTDKGERNFQAKADNAASRPAYVEQALGGHPVVQFAEPASLAIAGTTEPLNLGSHFTILYVARGTEGSFLSKGSGDSPGSFAWTRGAVGLQMGGASFAVPGDTGREARVRVVRADQDQIRWFIDGHAHHPAAQTGFEVQTRNVVRLGAVLKRPGDTQQFFQGQLAELLVYNRALDDDQRQRLEDYLTGKWLHGSDAPEPLTVELAAAIAEDEPADDAWRLGSDASTGAVEPESAGGETATEAEPPAREAASDREAELAAGYVTLIPDQLEASARSQLQLLDDGRILTDGGSRENEHYRIVIETPPATVTGFRLEAQPHESLPATGPGWAPGGRFALAQFRAQLEWPDGSQPAREVRFTAVAEPADDLAQRLVDGSDQSSWSIQRRGEVVPLTFLPTSPLEAPENSRLVITLVQRENLGCFRLLATSAADPLAAAVPGSGAVGTEGAGDAPFVLFANLGGGAYEDQEGNQWLESKKHGVQDFGHEGGMSAGKTFHPFPNLLWAETAVRGLTAFRAAVPDGVYEVTLCFCDQWTSDVTRRSFYTVWERGHPHALRREFHGPGIGGPWTHVERRVLVRDGQLDIEFSPLAEGSFAILNGIIIRQISDLSASGRRR